MLCFVNLITHITYSSSTFHGKKIRREETPSVTARSTPILNVFVKKVFFFFFFFRFPQNYRQTGGFFHPLRKHVELDTICLMVLFWCHKRFLSSFSVLNKLVIHIPLKIAKKIKEERLFLTFLDGCLV